jgi:hypothetical protein
MWSTAGIAARECNKVFKAWPRKSS